MPLPVVSLRPLGGWASTIVLARPRSAPRRRRSRECVSAFFRETFHFPSEAMILPALCTSPVPSDCCVGYQTGSDQASAASSQKPESHFSVSSSSALWGPLMCPRNAQFSVTSSGARSFRKGSPGVLVPSKPCLPAVLAWSNSRSSASCFQVEVTF